MGGGATGENENDRVSEWEYGLPSSDDLAPLSQCLISPELASAFNITPEPYRTVSDVHRASQTTISSIQGSMRAESDERGVVEEEDEVEGSKSNKRQRLVWTSQLHKRFVDVVDHLGIKNAVPKTIMQQMNVEGLTRENVASHLQKYRLYLKRMDGSLDEGGPSSSDHSYPSRSLLQGINGSGRGGHVETPMPYQMMQMPVMSGHGTYPWMHPQYGSSGSYHHPVGSNNN